MNKCCIKKLESVKERIENVMDCSMPDDFLRGLEAAIAEIDEEIFKSIANKE